VSKTLSRLTSKPLRQLVYKILYFGWARYCPVCRSRLRSFRPSGYVRRPDARCPVCRSLERHRLVWVFFGCNTNLFDGASKRMLHIAPERVFEARFRRISGLDYLTADLYNPRAMVKMDITDIQYPDGSFDVVYCSHVLEHVSDDRRAMRELSRVLKADGWAVILVPITAGKTFEDPSVTDPSERERLFGQRDHVRRYGPDVKDRLGEAGFSVRLFDAVEVVGEASVIKLGVKDSQVFFCEKAPAAQPRPPCF
jgi:SAM-dependent methyltransferase